MFWRIFLFIYQRLLILNLFLLFVLNCLLILIYIYSIVSPFSFLPNDTLLFTNVPPYCTSLFLQKWFTCQIYHIYAFLLNFLSRFHILFNFSCLNWITKIKSFFLFRLIVLFIFTINNLLFPYPFVLLSFFIFFFLQNHLISTP